ncbi:MAG: histone deacetylase [Planctomycetota bacterium]
MTKFFYSSKYTLKWPGHIFPVEKFELVYKKIKESYGENYIETPREGSLDDVLLVHTKEYIDRLYELTKTPELGYYEFEVPVSGQVLEAVFSSVGGTIAATEFAVKNKNCGFNIGGGFHHAHRDRGGGFCILNDIAIGAKYAQKKLGVKRIAIVDCDLHQGDGTASIFHNDYTVFTFSIHQENLYPPKQISDLDIGLDDFTEDREYLAKLEEALKVIADRVIPELVIYQAGADPYEKDQLGCLKITKDGLRKRDEIVIGWAKAMDIPLVITLGGGYPPDVNDVVDIHYNTAVTAIKYYL